MALSWRDFLPTDLGSGTDFSTGQRNVNLNRQFIDNTAYDKLKGGVQYEDAPEGLVWDANRNRYVKQGAPTGILGNILGYLDWANMDTTDWDRAGKWGDTNKYGAERKAGTLGGQRVQINPVMKNTEYNPNLPSYGDPYNPVPQIPTSKSYKDRIYDDIYSQVVDRWRMGGALNQAFEFNKRAQEQAAYLDYLNMQRAQNSPFGQSLMATQQQARMAAASEAVSNRKRAIADATRAASSPQLAAAAMYGALKTTG
tara:strand:- start:5528 stop:6292 length:765 start_codon:yes stop_codon:yes gene_type:complete